MQKKFLEYYVCIQCSGIHTPVYGDLMHTECDSCGKYRRCINYDHVWYYEKRQKEWEESTTTLFA